MPTTLRLLVFAPSPPQTPVSSSPRDLPSPMLTPLSPRSYKASIDVVTVDFHKASGATEPPLRVFLNFGEHGRELITTDVGLHVLKLLARRAVLTLTVEKLNLLKAHAATAETPVTHAW